MTSPESGPTSPQAQAGSVIWNPTLEIVTSVTNALNAIVTTLLPNNYLTGMYVLMNVPSVYGMVLNSVRTQIIVLSPTTFVTNINTLNQLAFSPPAFEQYTQAQVSPITGRFENVTPGSPHGNPTGG